jgi:RimJ/RimL family protein N-acetyltransferase
MNSSTITISEAEVYRKSMACLKILHAERVTLKREFLDQGIALIESLRNKPNRSFFYSKLPDYTTDENVKKWMYKNDMHECAYYWWREEESFRRLIGAISDLPRDSTKTMQLSTEDANLLNTWMKKDHNDTSKS